MLFTFQLLAKGIQDPDKSKLAIEVAKDFRIKIRECDDAATKGISEGIGKILENYPATSKDLTDFFDAMQDVPQDL